MGTPDAPGPEAGERNPSTWGTGARDGSGRRAGKRDGSGQGAGKRDGSGRGAGKRDGLGWITGVDGGSADAETYEAPADPNAASGTDSATDLDAVANAGGSADRDALAGGGSSGNRDAVTGAGGFAGPDAVAGAGGSADPEAAAREICLRLLSFSPRTRAQLADALRRKGVPEEVAERVLGRYTEVGLIDDAAFARAWVQSRHTGRGLARRALAAELRQRGVADDTVKEAVEELHPDQEETAARELIAKRMAATRGLDPTKRMRRILGVLGRKGYSSGLAYRLVREALENEGIDTPDVPLD
jgi:regulatory protein